MSQTTRTAWPEGVVARYLTVGGGTVDLIEQSGYYTTDKSTETHAACSACPAKHTVEWGWDCSANQYGNPQPDSFDEGGRYATPAVREWAQDHAETCRAMPKPTA